ncbi:MAG: hypothetical protein ACKVW3_12860 [Phycisphaerales bacterium]
MPDAAPIAASAHAGVAVVWHASPTLDTSKLLAALAKGGLRVINVRGPFQALAELRVAQRARADALEAAPSGTGRGNARVSGHTPTPALVMVDPADPAEALQLHEAVARYVPGVKAWLFGPGANPRLRPVVESDVEAWSTRATPAVGPVRTEPPRMVVPERRVERRVDMPTDPPLRLTGSLESDIGRADGMMESKGPGVAGATTGNSGASASKPLLTPEELELLLGDGRS